MPSVSLHSRSLPRALLVYTVSKLCTPRIGMGGAPISRKRAQWTDDMIARDDNCLAP